jgi:hypothetical protein
MKHISIFVLFVFFAGSLFANPYKPNVKELEQVKAKITQNFPGEKIVLKAGNVAHIFQAFQGKKLLGNVYFRILAPHGEDFTYFALLNAKRDILSFGILMYSCSTGEEVTTNSWGKRLLGKKAKNLSIGKDVDAVSGGTMTVEAIIEDLGTLK